MIKARLIALASMLDEEEQVHMVFDMDSYLMAINNCTSHMMTNQEADLFDVVTVHKDILGIGKTQSVKMGTFQLRIEDDDGMVHEHLIPETYFSPELPQSGCYLCSTGPDGNRHLHMHSDTDADRITLEWENNVRMIPLNAANVGVFRTAPGYRMTQKILTTLNACLHTGALLLSSSPDPS